MSDVRLLMQAYYEQLYDFVESNREALTAQVEPMLQRELDQRDFGRLTPDQITAYHEACQAFIIERIEMYNPVGMQYLFDRGDSQEAFAMQMELDWYDSRAEYAELVRWARQKVEQGLSDAHFSDTARQMVRQLGAFPDRSIIRDYEADPTLRKLPDYIVARTIEQAIR